MPSKKPRGRGPKRSSTGGLSPDSRGAAGTERNSPEAGHPSSADAAPRGKELRSTMEELETGREELQNMNEELRTVTQENRHKVDELAMLSSDLQNLLTAADIATLFLDRELRIQLFTPKASDIFNVRATDRGRPIFDLTHRLTYPELRDDAETVLERLVEIEREVPDDQCRWYLTYLRLYRGRDDRIAGVVITFVDITRRKAQEAEIQRLTRTLEQRVQERTRQVRQLTTSLVRAEQRERRRLSETLHDELQQILYGVQLKLRLARDEMAAGRSAEQDLQLKQAEELLARCTRLTRQLSVDLNPPILKHEGVRSILTWLQGHMRELHNLGIEIEAADEIQIPDVDARVLLFQVLRELLFNIAKHSGADKAKVTLDATDGEVTVVVADDGRGFDAGALDGQPVSEASLGLVHVKERVSMLGGRMNVDSRPGDGARITVVVPLAARIGES